jgi:hypothetical protein
MIGLGIITQHPIETAVTAVSAVLLLTLAVLAVRRACRAFGRLRARVGDENLLTRVTAAIATGVAAQGMWAFFDTLHIPVWLRVLFFAFLELMVVASAIRARSSMRDGHGTGVDGVAMWVLTCLSATLSATHAGSVGEVLFRLAAPLVAAWGWERSMALERRRRTGRKGINWRLTPERVFIRLGLADPSDRSASEVDTVRRLLRLAIAAKRARTAGWPRRWWTLRRLDRAMEGAVEYGGLGTDPDSRDMLMSTLGALVNASDLLQLRPPAPWDDQTPALAVPPEVSGLSERLPELKRGTDVVRADLGQPQTASDSDTFAGQAAAHALNAAILSAKADGLSVRDIATAFETTKYRVEKALATARGSDAPEATAETSEISPAEPGPLAVEPSAEPRRPDRTGRRFAVRLRRWLVTAEEAEPEPTHIVNGRAPAGPETG